MNEILVTCCCCGGQFTREEVVLTDEGYVCLSNCDGTADDE
jgi:hypothetical protein